MNIMSYKGYTARMDFDIEDKIIVGRVLDIDDIITFHGASVAEFEAALHSAVDSSLPPASSSGKRQKNQPAVA
jgi:predicted HicB family RNase H-like nuclease